MSFDTSFFTTSVKNVVLLACASVLLGRGWQGLFYDYPIREWLWDEELMTIVLSQKAFYAATSHTGDQLISYIGIGIGCLLALCLLTLFLGKQLRTVGLVLSTILLFLLTLCYWKQHYLQVAGLFEYSLQWMTPLLLFWIVTKSINQTAWIRVATVSICLTFFGHGAYALGWYATPGHFLDMTMSGFLVEEPTARLLLKIAGWADMLAVVFLLCGLISKHPIARWIFKFALLYCIIWGGATALARIVSHFSSEAAFMTIGSWWWQSVYRLPHALIPLAVLLSLPQYGKRHYTT